MKNTHSTTLNLKDGDTVVLYTDGIIEARRGREHYGLKRLATAIEDRRDLPVEQIRVEIMDEVMDWSGQTPEDYLTLLVMRYRA